MAEDLGSRGTMNGSDASNGAVVVVKPCWVAGTVCRLVDDGTDVRVEVLGRPDGSKPGWVPAVTGDGVTVRDVMISGREIPPASAATLPG